MAKLPTFQAGDRIAYTAQFLKSTGQRTGEAGFRRGTFLRTDPSMDANFARVKWDDVGVGALMVLAKQYGDDYADDVRENGSLVNLTTIAKVGPNSRYCAC